MIREVTPEMARKNSPNLIAKALTEQYATEMLKLRLDVKGVKIYDRESYADIQFKDPNKNQDEVEKFFQAADNYKVGEGKPDAQGLKQGVFPCMDSNPFEETEEERMENKARHIAKIAMEKGSTLDVVVESVCHLTGMTYKKAVELVAAIYHDRYNNELVRDCIKEALEDAEAQAAPTDETEDEEDEDTPEEEDDAEPADASTPEPQEYTGDAKEDPIYDEAFCFCVRLKKYSVPALKRKFNIGEQRAQRLIEKFRERYIPEDELFTEEEKAEMKKEREEELARLNRAKQTAKPEQPEQEDAAPWEREDWSTNEAEDDTEE